MATMATSHGLSVYVNSCVKNPVNSKTGQNVTFADRSSNVQKTFMTDPGSVVNDDSSDFDDQDDLPVRYYMPAGSTCDNITAQLRSVADEQFYAKLQKLKEENRKTLEECEKLYKEKYGINDKDKSESRSAKELVENMFVARLAERTTLYGGSVVEKHDGSTASHIFTPHVRDMVKDMSSKPPPAPSSVSKNRTQAAIIPVQSSTLPSRSSVPKPLSASAPIRTAAGYLRRAHSLDDDDWRQALRSSSDLSDNDQGDAMNGEDVAAADSKIMGMWHNFKIDDYTPQDQRRRSTSDVSKNWRHRITIPKPFEMTVRESAKIAKKKTKAHLELEQMRLKKQQEEEAECQRKFKAQPAPAHIYLPLYDEIQEKNESRRRYIKQYSSEILKSQVKPFNFSKREDEKKRARSVTVAEQIFHSKEKAKKEGVKFVARPVPQFVFSKEIDDKQLEEEEYRKIRKKMRAKELLMSASLPPGMAIREKLKEEKEKEKMQKSKQQIRNRRRPKSSHTVPDYDFLYREFQKELARRKQERESTVVKPFSLETERLRSKRDQVMLDIEQDEKTLKENRWPFQSSRTTPRSNLSGVLSTSLDSIPFKSSTSADLRSGFYMSKKEREQRLQELKLEEERRRQIREAKLRKYITDHSSDSARPRDTVKDQLRKKREEDQARQEEYQKRLEEMKVRVEERPLLVEQARQKSASKAAEKKFQNKLRDAGIDEDFVMTRSARATSAHSEDEDSTYNKSMLENREELTA